MIMKLPLGEVDTGVWKPVPGLGDIRQERELVGHFEVLKMVFLKEISEKLNVRLEGHQVPCGDLQDVFGSAAVVTGGCDPAFGFHLAQLF